MNMHWIRTCGCGSPLPTPRHLRCAPCDRAHWTAEQRRRQAEARAARPAWDPSTAPRCPLEWCGAPVEPHRGGKWGRPPRFCLKHRVGGPEHSKRGAKTPRGRCRVCKGPRGRTGFVCQPCLDRPASERPPASTERVELNRRINAERHKALAALDALEVIERAGYDEPFRYGPWAAARRRAGRAGSASSLERQWERMIVRLRKHGVTVDVTPVGETRQLSIPESSRPAVEALLRWLDERSPVDD